MPSLQVKLSVVVPAYNEEACLGQFFDRTFAALDEMNIDAELVVVNDGSTDETEAVIRRYVHFYPGRMKGVMLEKNVGQHTAIVAGFSVSEGEYIMTIDADLQNPPEEIGKVLSAISEGYDAIGTIREKRDDAFFRKLASKIVNIVVSIFNNGFTISDYGCMMRIFTKTVTDGICATHGQPDFIPVMAMAFVNKYREIPIRHEARAQGGSRYTFGSLIRLMLHLFRSCIRLKHPVKDSEPLATDYFRIREIVTK